jgi:hypothetical protein
MPKRGHEMETLNDKIKIIQRERVTCTHTFTCSQMQTHSPHTHIHTHTQRERERERETGEKFRRGLDKILCCQLEHSLNESTAGSKIRNYQTLKI